MKISNNSNIGDIIINGKPYNKDIDIEIVDNKICIGSNRANKTSLSIRIDSKLFDEVDEVKEKLDMSRTEFCEFLIKQGLNTYKFSPKTNIIFDIISKVKNQDEQRVLYLFLNLSQIREKIKFKDINFLAGTNFSTDEFIGICQKVSLENYFEDIEIIETERLRGEEIKKFLSSESYSREKDVEIRAKWKKNNE